MRIQPFRVLRGIPIRPAQTALLQTDGSYGAKYQPLSRTASLLINHKGEQFTYSQVYDNHTDSTESEWCSVLDGIQFAIEKGEWAIELENDNTEVIRCISLDSIPKRPHIAEYHEAIYNHINTLEYFSIRWIPRRFNAADVIFRLPR